MRCTNDNFESVLVSQASIPTEPIPVPKDVIASDGKLLAHITHHTAPFTHTHCETLQFCIISSPHSRLVFGLPWLKHHTNWTSVTPTTLFGFEKETNGRWLLTPTSYTSKHLVISFGFTNALAVFQALVNDLLRDMLNRFIFVYLWLPTLLRPKH